MINLVQKLMDSRADWLEHLVAEYKIDAVRDGDLVSLKYNQIESPMHEPIVDDKFNRVKIKSPRYVALHHLKGNATPRRAIELWQTGEHEELLAHFPEFRPAIEPVHDKLDEFARRAVFEHEQTMQCTTDRKGYAALAVQYPFSAVMFRMLTNGRATVDEAKAIMRGMSLAALERMVDA